jgi:hypothetical protein
MKEFNLTFAPGFRNNLEEFDGKPVSLRINLETENENVEIEVRAPADWTDAAIIKKVGEGIAAAASAGIITAKPTTIHFAKMETIIIN